MTKNRFSASVLVTLALIFSGGCSGVQDRPPSGQSNSPTGAFSSADGAARDALVIMKNEVSADPVSLGLDPAEMNRVELGKPEKVFTIPVQKLADYKPGSDVQAILEDTHRMVYPVMLAGRGRALITVEQTPQGWQMVGFGQGKLAKNLVDAQSETTSSAKAQVDSTFNLQVQTVNRRDFLARVEAGPGGGKQIKLIPLNAPSEVPTHGPGMQNKQVVSSMKTLNKYSKSLYSVDMRTTEFIIDAHKVEANQKSAGDVIEALTPLAKEAQSRKSPPQ